MLPYRHHWLKRVSHCQNVGAEACKLIIATTTHFKLSLLSIDKQKKNPIPLPPQRYSFCQLNFLRFPFSHGPQHTETRMHFSCSKCCFTKDNCKCSPNHTQSKVPSFMKCPQQGKMFSFLSSLAKSQVQAATSIGRLIHNLLSLTPAFFTPYMTDQILGQNISDNTALPPVAR